MEDGTIPDDRPHQEVEVIYVRINNIKMLISNVIEQAVNPLEGNRQGHQLKRESVIDRPLYVMSKKSSSRRFVKTQMIGTLIWIDTNLQSAKASFSLIIMPDGS